MVIDMKVRFRKNKKNKKNKNIFTTHSLPACPSTYCIILPHDILLESISGCVKLLFRLHKTISVRCLWDNRNGILLYKALLTMYEGYKMGNIKDIG